MYFGVGDVGCATLAFSLGRTGVGASIPTRSFSIKVRKKIKWKNPDEIPHL